MSYTVEKLEKSQIKLVFDVDATTFAKAVDAAYEKTKHKYAIPGFRKGKAPKKVIENAYGKGVFFDDALNIVIDDEYGKALDEQKELEIIPRSESLADIDIKDDGSVTFAILATVQPDVILGAYKGLEVEKKVERITAKKVDEYVANEQEKQARLIDVEQPAQNGNTVTIDFLGSVDGVKFDGGAGENYDLELGSGTFIPGFEEQLVGTKAGEEKDVVVTFPADYQAENLAGKEAVFACTVKAVKVKELPALDDEFAKEISEFDTLAEYKADVKAMLEKQAQETADRAYEDALMDKIVETSSVEIPEIMIENEAQELVQEFEYRLMYQGLQLDDYLKYLGQTREQFADQYKEQAQKRVKARLVISAIIKAEDIQIADADIDAKLAEMAERSSETLEEYKKKVNKDQIDYIVNTIIFEKLFAMLKAENGVKKAAKKAPAKKADAESVEPQAEADGEPKKKTTKKSAPKADDAE